MTAPPVGERAEQMAPSARAEIGDRSGSARAEIGERARAEIGPSRAARGGPRRPPSGHGGAGPAGAGGRRRARGRGAAASWEAGRRWTRWKAWNTPTMRATTGRVRAGRRGTSGSTCLSRARGSARASRSDPRAPCHEGAAGARCCEVKSASAHWPMRASRGRLASVPRDSKRCSDAARGQCQASVLQRGTEAATRLRLAARRRACGGGGGGGSGWPCRSRARGPRR